MNTQKSMVSKAVAKGELETNGKTKTECRIKGSSVIEWITSVNQNQANKVGMLK